MNKRFTLSTILFVLFVVQFIITYTRTEMFGWDIWTYILLTTTILNAGVFIGLFISYFKR